MYERQCELKFECQDSYILYIYSQPNNTRLFRRFYHGSTIRTINDTYYFLPYVRRKGYHICLPIICQKKTPMNRARWLQKSQGLQLFLTDCNCRLPRLEPSNQVAIQAKLGLQPGCWGELEGGVPPPEKNTCLAYNSINFLVRSAILKSTSSYHTLSDKYIFNMN